MKLILILILLLVVVEGINLLKLQRQRSRYSNYWLAQANTPIPPNALIYVALGDSTAQGIGASRPQKGYVGLLTEKLKEKNGRPVHVTNLSSTGGRLQDILDKQLPELKKLNLQPDTVVTLAIGANNIRSYDEEDFRRNMEEIITQLPKQAIVADIPYFGGGRANSGEVNATNASAITSELAAKHHIKLARVHDSTKASNSWLNYAADFFHPNDRGYHPWFEAFWLVLEKDPV